MILKLSRRSLLTVIVLTSVCILACSCRTPFTRKPVDFGKARMTSSHVDIVIDGKESSQEEWMDSVAVLLKPNGQAEFLWNDKGVYVRFSGKSFRAVEPESLILHISDVIESSNSRSVMFKFQGRGPIIGLVEVIPDHNRQKSLLPPFDQRMIQFESTGHYAKRATPWSAELYMSWELLGCDIAPRGTLFIHVYRVVKERPTSLLKMKKLECHQSGPEANADKPRP